MVRKIKNFLHLFISVVSVAYYRYPARNMTVIGITGTDGKTTTSHLIYHLLKSAGYHVGLISTIGAFYNDQKIDTGFHTTNPDAPRLQSLINKMKKIGVKYLVLEVTSHGLDQYRVFGCNFKVGVLTNITHEHLDYHQTLDNLIRAKVRLLTSADIAIINQQDPSYLKVKSLISQGNNKSVIVTYPGSGLNKLVLTAINNRFPELYNRLNAEAAALAVSNVGLPIKNIPQAIKTFTGVPGRMEHINIGQKFTVIVDFAHTPNALKNVLVSLRKNLKGRAKLICVFGCAGERDKVKRPMMGKIATQLANLSIFTAEDPRTEDVNDIIPQIVSGVVNNSYITEPDRKKAIDIAVKTAESGDIVIICGKGHEKTMCFEKTEIPWSDQEVVLASIRNLLKPRSSGSDFK